MISYGTYCGPKGFHFSLLNRSAFAWIILLSCSPTMTSWIFLGMGKKQNTCTTPMVSKRRPKCSCTFSRNPTNSNQPRRFLYSPHSMSKSSGRISTTTDHLCSFWLRFSRDATPSQQRRFIDTCQAYVRAAQEQVVNRVDQSCPTIESYVELRRQTSAIWVRSSGSRKYRTGA